MFINKKFSLMSMTKPAYRIAKEEDIGAIMKMQFKLFKRWDSMDKIDKIDNSWFFSNDHKERILDLLNSKTKRLYVALFAKKIVGYLNAEILEREPFLQKVGYISETYIVPQHRDKMVGTKLVKLALEWFKESGLNWTIVSTHSLDKQAINFWGKQGYREFNKFFKMKL